MTLSIDHRPLVTMAWNVLLRRRRPIKEGDLMDVCLQWKSSQWAPALGIYTRRGPLHVTLCCHEGLRGVVLRSIARMRPANRPPSLRRSLALNGLFFDQRKYTSRITIFFFTFCLAIEWCTKISIEKVDVWDVAKNAAK